MAFCKLKREAMAAFQGWLECGNERIVPCGVMPSTDLDSSELWMVEGLPRLEQRLGPPTLIPPGQKPAIPPVRISILPFEELLRRQAGIVGDGTEFQL